MCSLGEGPRFGHTVFVQLGRRAGGAGITIVINTLHCTKHFWVHCIGSATLYLCSLGEGLVLEGAGITIVINTLHCIKHFWVHCIGSAVSFWARGSTYGAFCGNGDLYAALFWGTQTQMQRFFVARGPKCIQVWGAWTQI